MKKWLKSDICGSFEKKKKKEAENANVTCKSWIQTKPTLNGVLLIIGDQWCSFHSFIYILHIKISERERFICRFSFWEELDSIIEP